MKGWSEADIEKLKQKGMVAQHIAPKLLQKVQKACKKEPAALIHIKEVLWLLKVPYETEYIFHPARKWRFDVAISEHKVAIEYEGVISSDKSRHTTIVGFSNDCRKYNQAQLYGWKILRYTALNYKEFYSELKQLIEI